MGGHAQDVSIWFDETGGRWISSTAFARDGKLPAWVEARNMEAIPNRSLGTSWVPMVPAAVLARTIALDIKPEQARGFGAAFPHRIGAEQTSANYSLFTLLPAANAFVFETAKRAVTAEKLGQHDVPDLLAINLSTNDYVGHVFGPDSPEVLDLSVQTDRQLAGFGQGMGDECAVNPDEQTELVRKERVDVRDGAVLQHTRHALYTYPAAQSDPDATPCNRYTASLCKECTAAVADAGTGMFVRAPLPERSRCRAWQSAPPASTSPAPPDRHRSCVDDGPDGARKRAPRHSRSRSRRCRTLRSDQLRY